MKTLLELITIDMREAFAKAGYDEELAKVTLSNRPDLCEYQCNGAMAAAKAYHKKPIDIANQVVEALGDGGEMFSMAQAVMPGFINLKLAEGFLASYMEEMAEAYKLGLEEPEKKETIIVDYGGANVAKPLHVGHLRSAVIGECVKRLGTFMGHQVIGDVHLWEWGLQRGLIL